MGKAETLIEEAIQYAQSRGVKIKRRAVFNWCANNNPYDSQWASYPIECNAIGAILLKLGKENLVKEEFTPGWMKEVSEYLEEDGFWIWKFVSGFDYGNKLTITHVKKKKGKDNKESTEFSDETDKVSRLGDTLARRYG
jgi:hypothetical protein